LQGKNNSSIKKGDPMKTCNHPPDTIVLFFDENDCPLCQALKSLKKASEDGWHERPDCPVCKQNTIIGIHIDEKNTVTGDCLNCEKVVF
jgi:hypothetical protein